MKKLLFLVLIPCSLFAEVRKDQLYGVDLESSKHDQIRNYQASFKKVLPYPIDLVKKGITNFTDKCNNDLRGLRKFTDSRIECRYHNENIIESFVVTKVNQDASFEHFDQNILIGRQIYNRGSYGYYELAQIKNSVEGEKKIVSISVRMLSDQEAAKLTSPKLSKDSAFDKAQTQFTLKELGPNHTELTYVYTAETDHWLLNKEVAVAQVFASLSKSVTDLIQTVERESHFQKRELASQD
jgi:hypothetical protein